MRCTEVNREGIYRRKRKHDNFDPFTSDMYHAAAAAHARVIAELAIHRHIMDPHFPGPRHTDFRLANPRPTNSRFSYSQDTPKVLSN